MQCSRKSEPASRKSELDEEQIKQLNPYLLSYWRDLHVSSGCVCMEEKVAITNALEEALTEDVHASHPDSWGNRLYCPTLLKAILEPELACSSNRVQILHYEWQKP